jgi:hypothetical protein
MFIMSEKLMVLLLRASQSGNAINATSRPCLKLAEPDAGDTEEGPSRTEGVVPLPRSERGGSRAAAQGVLIDIPWGRDRV